MKPMRLIMAICFLAQSACAPMSEQYWSDRYASMTREEIEDARTTDITATDIWIGARTSSKLVCINGECFIVQVFP